MMSPPDHMYSWTVLALLAGIFASIILPFLYLWGFITICVLFLVASFFIEKRKSAKREAEEPTEI